MYSKSIENLNTTIKDETFDQMPIVTPPIEFSATDSNNPINYSNGDSITWINMNNLFNQTIDDLNDETLNDISNDSLIFDNSTSVDNLKLILDKDLIIKENHEWIVKIEWKPVKV